MSGSATEFDVIVVGGGPAGAATAICTAARGLRTLVLEGSGSPHRRPGETLHPGTHQLFRLLGVDTSVDAAGFLRHAGYFIRTHQQEQIYSYGSDHQGELLGYQADRAKLESILLNGALCSGSLVKRRQNVLSAIVEGGVVTGVASKSSMYSARFVVDATGSLQWLRRQLKLPLLRVSRFLIANYGWADLPEGEESDGILPEFNVDKQSWTWIAPITPTRRAWVSLDLNSSLGHDAQIPHQVASFRSVGRLRRSDVTWRLARPCAGPGYFLVGDAAWVVDPASSHGVLKALVSGIVAADAIRTTIERQERSSKVRSSYCAWMERWFCTDASALISLYLQMVGSPSWLAAASEAVRYISMNPSA
jgi:flavin-dependent dehydrogenase